MESRGILWSCNFTFSLLTITFCHTSTCEYDSATWLNWKPFLPLVQASETCDHWFFFVCCI